MSCRDAPPAASGCAVRPATTPGSASRRGSHSGRSADITSTTARITVAVWANSNQSLFSMDKQRRATAKGSGQRDGSGVEAGHLAGWFEALLEPGR
jgi:hypothetical protein